MTDEMVREDPPKVTSNRRPLRWGNVVEKLKADPGVWYRITNEENQYSQLARNIRKGINVAFRPAGAFEAVSRTHDDKSAVTVWARYIGESGEFAKGQGGSL